MSPRSRKRGSNRSNRSGPHNRRQRGGQGQRRAGGAGFWGQPAELPAAPQQVRITEDPSAVVRSLGPPPLPGHEVIAEHYFAAVYERAITLASALAAAGGLIKPEELLEERGD